MRRRVIRPVGAGASACGASSRQAQKQQGFRLLLLRHLHELEWRRGTATRAAAPTAHTRELRLPVLGRPQVMMQLLLGARCLRLLLRP